MKKTMSIVLLFVAGSTMWVQSAFGMQTTPDVITVVGIASNSTFPVVTTVSTSDTITDSSAKASSKDDTTFKMQIIKHLSQMGIPRGDIFFPSPTYNNSQNAPDQTPNLSQQVTVIVSQKVNVIQVANFLDGYSPRFVTGGYTNTQVVPLNPVPWYPILMKQALANARQQATMLAQQEGETIGMMVNASTAPLSLYGQSMPAMNSNAPSVAGPYATSPVVSGLQLLSYDNGQNLSHPELVAQVLVSFSLIQK